MLVIDYSNTLKLIIILNVSKHDINIVGYCNELTLSLQFMYLLYFISVVYVMFIVRLVTFISTFLLGLPYYVRVYLCFLMLLKY